MRHSGIGLETQMVDSLTTTDVRLILRPARQRQAKVLDAIVLGIQDQLIGRFGIGFSMKKKIKTKYQAKDGQLLYEGKPTKILVNDDYFF